MLDDVLKETPVYQYIAQTGRDEARLEARQQELARQRQALAAIIQGRFPALIELAEKQMTRMDDPEAVNLLIINISIAKDSEEARRYLVQAGKKKRKKTT